MATKISFELNDEDLALLKRLQAKLGATIGKASYIAVIRWAMRLAEQAK